MLKYSNLFAVIGFLSFVIVLTSIHTSPAYSDAASASGAIVKTPVYFSIEKDTNNEKIARKAINDLLQKAETEVGRVINIATARIDLNRDGVKELFVRLLDQDSFCEDEVCAVVGFALTDKGLVKIAELKARTMDALESHHNGTKDLLVSLSPEDDGIVYTWQNGFYKKQEVKE